MTITLYKVNHLSRYVVVPFCIFIKSEITQFDLAQITMKTVETQKVCLQEEKGIIGLLIELSFYQGLLRSLKMKASVT